MAIPQPNFRPDFNITRASHVVLRVTDLAASRAFYVDTLGFLVSGEDNARLYLRGLEEACHHSLVLEQAPEPSCARVGLRVLTEDDLDCALAHFKAHGLAARTVDVPHQGRTIQVSDPLATPLEICASMETRPRSILTASAFRGASPQRLDHVQVSTPQVGQALDFYMAMGFRLSEYIVPDEGGDPAFVFLQRKGNPHDIVFAHGAGPRLHHTAFMVPETSHLMFACDALAENGFGRAVEFGPGRHYGPGYARFVYLRDPDNHRIELFTTHYQTIDCEDEPIRWTFSELQAAGWGPPPPDTWLHDASRFKDVVVENPAHGVGAMMSLTQA